MPVVRPITGAAIILALVRIGSSSAQVTLSAHSKPFLDYDRAELVRAVPELSGIQFDPSENNLNELLRATGENLRSVFPASADISAGEEIHEMRFEDSMVETSRRESFRYVVRRLPDGAREQFEEFRTDPNTGLAVRPVPESDFLVIGHFFKLLRYLLPEYREQSHFRYLGRWTAPGQDYFVVAFAQRPESEELQSHIQIKGGRTALLQGIVWIDRVTSRIVRLRLDMLGRIEDFPFETLTTDISLAPINFQAIRTEFWLPARVTVHARYSGGEVHSVHRYSDYRLNGADDGLHTYQAEKRAGIPGIVAISAEDPWELVDRGTSLAKLNNPGEAVAAFRAALSLNPDMAVGQYNLAAELRATGDLAGAETVLREGVKRAPKSEPVHNLLGILLFKRGDVLSAVTEFRTSAQLEPTNATPHFNLAQALEKLGDRKAALEEYQTASTLEPDNAVFKDRYKQLERTPNVPTAPTVDTTIKVEVRQVLVPVIVTDKDAHHVTGLTQADFSIFEDGVEQRISAFSVESAGLPHPGTGSSVGVKADPEHGTALASPKEVPLRRTYVICIDALDASFSSFAHLREALVKLFRREQPGDSQYAVISLGIASEVMRSMTRDPASVLEMVESQSFEKAFQGSRKSSAEAELNEFRRTLDDVRALCDSPAPLDQRECKTQKSFLAPRAGQIATRDQARVTDFVRQFHSIVEELSRTGGGGRRMIVLISDGFRLVPGDEAFGLLAAYFPEFRYAALHTTERMQDQLEPILRLASKSNLPIYTIDSRGLYSSGALDASIQGFAGGVMSDVQNVLTQIATEQGNTLAEIATATGGTAFHNDNDLLTGLQRAFADGREYYLLAYVPSNNNPDGKFHAITVRVRDSKMLVSAKRGYWATAN